jgi:sugar O-acyltransferase (sialic acid O-acetyltransferase NeuD family)
MHIAVFGVGGFGREVAPLAREYASMMEGDASVIFVDDDPKSADCNGYPVIGFDELISPAHKNRHIVVAVGDGRTRERIEKRCMEVGLTIGSVFASSARILDHNIIAPGAVFCDYTMVTSNARIGKSFQANIFSYVAHDCVIGDYVTFAPRVCCNGNVHIQDYAYVGTGAVFNQGQNNEPLIVGEGAIIGMGAVVTKSVEPYTVVVGSPAKAIRALPR